MKSFKGLFNNDKQNEIDIESHARVGDLIIINAYTQYDFKGAGTLADYEAIRSVFKAIKTDFSGLRIGYPAIGAGLARGDWSLISKIITEELKGEDHTFVEYTR